MPRPRIPEGDDWKDHAVPCPVCQEPVMNENEHYRPPMGLDDGYWECG